MMWIGLSIAIGTLVSEDASTIGAGLLVSANAITAIEGIVWAGLGIWIGDLGLFGIGRLARTAGPVARWVDRRWPPGDRARLAPRLERRVPAAILISRFVPGTRLALYVASGVLPVSVTTFAASTLVASALWSTGVVLGVAFLGRAPW